MYERRFAVDFDGRGVDGDDAEPPDPSEYIPVPAGKGILNLRELFGDEFERNQDIDLTILTGDTAPSTGFCAAILGR